ncbi:hypothetical protein [Mesorhizobium sp. Cs1299R1N3]|uniref:hypothetical protein n=1 Tax=Mesorhizobium sp. Cs1299R1N3 TaxID=3015173 RepID=UPI00301E5851
MADSDNTMTLPFVTRRRLLAGGMITSTALVLEKSALAGNAVATSAPPDPALTLWREWQTACKLTERLCRRQQRLETKLVEIVGFPCATVRLPEGEDVMVHSIRALNEVLGKGPDMTALRETAEADFTAHQTRWDAAAEETGYTAALRAEREAGERAGELLEALSTTPATTLAGRGGQARCRVARGRGLGGLLRIPLAANPLGAQRYGAHCRAEDAGTVLSRRAASQAPQAAGWLLFPRLKDEDGGELSRCFQPKFRLQPSPSTRSEASASRRPSTGRELPAPDASNCDTALKKGPC